MSDEEKQAREDLKEFLAWIVEVIEFVPLTEGSKRVVDLLIEAQKEGS